MRTILSPINGQIIIPSSKNLNVQPLTLMGKPVTNGNGKVVMNDTWIYIKWPGYGLKAINVYRAHYCEKMYLADISIQNSIGVTKIMSKDLKKFVDRVSDKLVFEKYGKWYRIYVRKISSRTYDIDKVVPYNWTIAPNIKVGGHIAHQCCIDWRSAFYVK